MKSHYTIIIQWSDANQCYIVSLPERGKYCHTHGKTYEEALQNAREVLAMLTESTFDDDKPLPQPQLFGQHPQ